MGSMIIELREYRQFRELTAITDCGIRAAERRWDFLLRFLLMRPRYNLYWTAETARGARIPYEFPSSATAIRHVM